MFGDFIGVEDRLRQALRAGQLSGPQEARGEALLSRLISPVRVAVLGQRRSGKTSVFNVLAGSPVLPLGMRLPTAQLMWGLPPETTLTYPDRSTRTYGVPTEAEFADGTPIFISMLRDLPALRRLALLEVVMDGDVEKQSRAMAWAAARCDLIVWCTRTMDEMELHLMSMLPGALRKHAIVALTYPDALGGPDAVEERLDEIRGLVGEETQIVRPVDARTAMLGLSHSGPSVAEALRASGADALVGAVLEKVDAGSARVREAAENLLEDAALTAARAATAALDAVSRPVDGASAAQAASASPDPAPAQGPAPVQAVAREAAQPYKHPSASDRPRHAPVGHHRAIDAPPKLETPVLQNRPAFASSGAVAPAAEAPATDTLAATEAAATASQAAEPNVPDAPAAAPLASPQPASPQDDAPEDANPQDIGSESAAMATSPFHPANPIQLTAEGRETVASAIRYLSERGAAWAEIARKEPDAAGARIMTEVLADAEWLSSYLNDPFGPDDAVVSPAREMASDAYDLVQLMEVEGGSEATGDAVCLLLQARRCLEGLVSGY
ncbi:MAG: hypothetical protein AAGG09_09500 [Pseudomonadota bacterium]